jgi:hypothetical protein
MTNFFLEPSWNIEPWVMSAKQKKRMQKRSAEGSRDGKVEEEGKEEREDIERRGGDGGSGEGEGQHTREGDVEDTKV